MFFSKQIPISLFDVFLTDGFVAMKFNSLGPSPTCTTPLIMAIAAGTTPRFAQTRSALF